MIRIEMEKRYPGYGVGGKERESTVTRSSEMNLISFKTQN